jgi:hypothetical protein
VRVDQARDHETIADVERLLRSATIDAAAHGHDLSVADPDVVHTVQAASRIDHSTASQQEIEALRGLRRLFHDATLRRATTARQARPAGVSSSPIDQRTL